MDLQNKIVVITGGTSGIGLVTVTKLLSKDIKFIALFELDNPNTRDVFKELEKEFGIRIGFYPTDVTVSAQLSENLSKVIESQKTIDILINNAGTIMESNYERMIDINYKAVVVGSLKLIERLGKHKGGPGVTIVNVASILGLSNKSLPVYCSSKHAVVSFTRTMGVHYDVTGVRVVAICPGVTVTPLLKDLPNGLDFVDCVEKVAALPTQPPENVANAIVKIIEAGKPGDVWVAEANQPPYAVSSIEDYRTLRITE